MLRDVLFAWYFRTRLRGFARLWRCFQPERTTLVVAGRYGTRMIVDPTEYVDQCVVRHRGYESELVEAAARLAPRDCIIWDVGANIGTFCVLLSRVRPDLRIFAFEPNPVVACRLQQNILINHSRIILHTFALAEKTGLGSLHLTEGNAGLSSLVGWDASSKRYAVSTVRADALIAADRLPMPVLVKIDVEGAESAVLEGFGQFVRSLQTVLFEAAPCDINNRAGVAGMLERAGFTISQLKRLEPTSHNLENYIASRDATFSFPL
jgi:FkbM family methyltransferase